MKHSSDVSPGKLTKFKANNFPATHLPEYLVGEPLHLRGILRVAFGSTGVGKKLGGLGRDHSSCHLANLCVIFPASNPSCHGT